MGDRRVLGVISIGMVVYSVALLWTELHTSQDFVRHYFTDITGPVPFYAANTSLNVFLLGGAALLFAVSFTLLHGSPPQPSRARFFDFSQVLIFCGLALDERFLLHEASGARLGIEDAILLAVVGVTQLVLLFLYRDTLPVGPAKKLVLGAGAFFGVMLLIDALAPLDGRLRLSIEDLSKSWGSLLIFLYAWAVTRGRFEKLVAVQQPCGSGTPRTQSS